jgi:hypothetical protein
VAAHDFAARSKAKARARRSIAAQAFEGPEDTLGIRRVDAPSVIAHGEQPGAILRGGGDLDSGRRGPATLERVPQEVLE